MLVLTPYMKLTLALAIAGFVVHFVGFVTPYWYGDGHLSTGLWLKCGPLKDFTSTYTACHAYFSPLPGLMIARCFETLAFLGFIGLFISLGFYFTKDTYRFLMMSLIGSWVIVLFIMVGIIAWIATLPYHVNWSLVFVVLSACITSGAGGILIRERIKRVWV